METRNPAQFSKADRPDGSLRRDLSAGYGDGMAFGVMVGFGETYLPAFVLAVGLSEITAGLAASVPLIAGGIMQLVSPFAIRRLGSHRRWVLICASVQALSFVPLILSAWVGGLSTAAVLLIASLYWAAGLATGPAWNTWMGTIVPRAVRASFFTNRTRLSQMSVFAGFLIGGGVLHFSAEQGRLLTAFAALFVTAGLFRLLSVFFLSRQSEPVPIPPNMQHVSLVSFLKQLREGNGAQLLVYLVVVQAAVQLAGPYFTPFMFQKLNLSYGEFVILISASFLAKIVSLPLWGRVAHKIGAYTLLWIGGVGIVPVSGMWLVSSHFSWLLVIQIFGGITWAAYELAFFLQFFESIPEDERTSVLTIYNFINATAWVCGAVLGGCLLAYLDSARDAYLILFGLSSVGRGLALIFLKRVPAIAVEAAGMGVRTMGVRPSSASIDSPILPSLPDQASEAPEGV